MHCVVTKYIMKYMHKGNKQDFLKLKHLAIYLAEDLARLSNKNQIYNHSLHQTQILFVGYDIPYTI